MRLKSGVSLTGVQDVTLRGMAKIDRILRARGAELVVTSTIEGHHKADSLHPKGLAFDARSWAIPRSEIPAVIILFRKALGPDWDVLFESNPPHFHFEFDPKNGRRRTAAE